MLRPLLFLGLSVPLFAQPLYTDSRNLPRDLSAPAPHLVDPQRWHQVPWQPAGPGMRRRVLFSDRMTMVMLEIDRQPETGPISTHYHVHDQITMLLEGRARVQVGSEQSEIGAGGAYAVPSNVRHGLQPLTQRLVLVECFTPTREDFRSLGPNEVKAFVYRWFSLFDRNAPTASFLECLSDSPRVTFPDTPLVGREAFAGWYEQIRRRHPQVQHDVQDVVVTPEEGNRFRVSLRVGWKSAGQPVVWFRQRWLVEAGSGRPRIVESLVTPE